MVLQLEARHRLRIFIGVFAEFMALEEVCSKMCGPPRYNMVRLVKWRLSHSAYMQC